MMREAILSSSPGRGGGLSNIDWMVEGAACRAQTPLRQPFGLPPPRPGEDKATTPCSINGRQLALGGALTRMRFHS